MKLFVRLMPLSSVYVASSSIKRSCSPVTCVHGEPPAVMPCLIDACVIVPHPNEAQCPVVPWQPVLKARHECVLGTSGETSLYDDWRSLYHIGIYSAWLIGIVSLSVLFHTWLNRHAHFTSQKRISCSNSQDGTLCYLSYTVCLNSQK